MIGSSMFVFPSGFGYEAVSYDRLRAIHYVLIAIAFILLAIFMKLGNLKEK